jgi:hypothetical protein
MANRQIAGLDSEDIDLSKVFPFQIADGSEEAVNNTLQSLKDNFSTLSVSTLIPNGTDDSTTAKLTYGLNVVLDSDTSDFCTRLPETPTEGRSVTIINKSTYVLRVFPSVTGGSINGVVDGFVDIVPDSQAYTIYCYENPNPGDWGADPIQTSLFSIPEMSISHTNGVANQYHGIGTAVSGPEGVSIDGNGNLLLTPSPNDWTSLDSITSYCKLKVATNIVAADFGVSGGISCGISRGYKIGANAGLLDVGNSISFIQDGPNPTEGGGFVNGGVLSSPPNVGDAGTLYGEIVQVSGSLGLGGQYSRYYFTFSMQIPANMASKTYKFKFSIEYI